MNTLPERLAYAIKLHESEKHGEARQILLELQGEFPDDPQINYQCAWIYDLLGLERETVPFYETAVQTSLSGYDLKSALLGLGRTYRCVGEYQKSIETFQHALAFFRNSYEFNVFLGMAYYNIGEYSKAMALLLDCPANISTEEGILRYRRAIHFYSDKLDQIW
jgi:tetratricopeptide (TPR) repeat protein